MVGIGWLSHHQLFLFLSCHVVTQARMPQREEMLRLSVGNVTPPHPGNCILQPGQARRVPACSWLTPVQAELALAGFQAGLGGSPVATTIQATFHCLLGHCSL